MSLSETLLIPGLDEESAAPSASLEWTGPASGAVGAQSTDFTVEITDPPSGDTVITFASDGSGDTFSVATRTLNSGALTGTVKLTPGTSGARNVTITNDRSIANPAAVVYTASYDADYQAILDRATTLGYTLPSAAQRIKQDTLLRALKTAGVWTKLDTFWVFANDGSKEFATLNWRAPASYQATLVSTPTFTSNQGFTGDGAASYVDTNFNCGTNGVNYVQDDASRFAWVFATTAGQIIDGIASAATNRMFSSNAGTHRINSSTTNLSGSADLTGTGHRALYRTSSSNVECFAGTTQTSRTATSSGMTSGNQLVLRSSTSYSTNTISLYGLGASLVAENTDLNTALAAYMGSL